jgi:hypothetical protein
VSPALIDERRVARVATTDASSAAPAPSPSLEAH